jgi:autophagy-related protein 2
MASYLLPSFFQKRLLKYALSRLGLFDTDALDPDNLGITWGQRSTVELRDVGLKLEVSKTCNPDLRSGALIPRYLGPDL